jgi:hypothetical protein
MMKDIPESGSRAMDSLDQWGSHAELHTRRRDIQLSHAFGTGCSGWNRVQRKRAMMSPLNRSSGDMRGTNSDHTALLPAALDRAEVDRLDLTLTYNTFGRKEEETPARLWSVRAEPSQQACECDYGTNDFMFDTLHRVWIL